MKKYLLAEGLATENRARRATKRLCTTRSRKPPIRRWRWTGPTRTAGTSTLYSEAVDPTSAEFATEPTLSGKDGTMVDLLNACLRDEMAHNPDVLVFGQDVADASREENLTEVKGKGGVFKVTFGLQREFGSKRVWNSPLAEASIVGMALGAAVRWAQARRRDPVLRLHLARVHAASKRSRYPSLALGGRVQLSPGGARAYRRLFDWRLHIPQPIG